MSQHRSIVLCYSTEALYVTAQKHCMSQHRSIVCHSTEALYYVTAFSHKKIVQKLTSKCFVTNVLFKNFDENIFFNFLWLPGTFGIFIVSNLVKKL